jgi:hypothetical protein
MREAIPVILPHGFMEWSLLKHRATLPYTIWEQVPDFIQITALQNDMQLKKNKVTEITVL